jgi:ABC-2 type transport system ATP-binding protein
MTNAIETESLHKSFNLGSTPVEALAGLSIRVPVGGIYGILGQNGAGKTTLFRICLGLIRPDGGSIRVLNRVPATDAKLFGAIGAMVESPRFFNYITARDTLRMLVHLSGRRRADNPDSLLKRVGLAEAADRKVHGFSVGMKQRLGIAAALVSRPELLILDEPTSGLDPVGIQEMRLMIRELATRDGVTVIFASHQLDEVSKLCDRVAILHKGHMLAEGTVAELLRSRSRLRLQVTPIEKTVLLLGERGTRDGAEVLAAIDREEAPRLIESLVSAGVRVFEARWESETLEQVFLSHVSGLLNAQTSYRG